MAAPKWRIRGLTKKTTLQKAAAVVIRYRIRQLVRYIDIFLKENSVENLHQVRIAIRRLRYGMELFIDCFEDRRFMQLYNRVEVLQDITGDMRDNHILQEKFELLFPDAAEEIRAKYIAKFTADENKMNDHLRAVLTVFKEVVSQITFLKIKK
jgi:CHAD domain-containing protein